jgi:hypothetical protein
MSQHLDRGAVVLSEEDLSDLVPFEQIRRTQERLRDSIREAAQLLQKTQELIERLRAMREASRCPPSEDNDRYDGGEPPAT